MSIIVAVRKGNDIAMGADTQASFGSQMVSRDNHRASKIRRIGHSLIGTTGWGVYDNILEDFFSREKFTELNNQQTIFSFFLKLWRELHENYSFVKDQCNDESSPFGDLDASFMVVNPDGIFYVASDMSVSQFQQYFAIGSGSCYSLGALYSLYNQDIDPAALTRKAIEAATVFDLYCGGETDIQRLKSNAI